MLLALVFAGVTLRMAAQLIRGMEWQTAELGRVSWHMLEDQEATARRFSHELHDELGQSLTAVKTNLTALESGGAFHRERLDDCLQPGGRGDRQRAADVAAAAADDPRRFRPGGGMRWLAEGFAARTGIEVKVDSTYPGRLPDETETHLFRIAQEALTNVARHSGAKHVTHHAWRRTAAISGSAIQDEGAGSPDTPSPASRGLGLIGIRARARSAGGDADDPLAPGRGCSN